MLVKVAPPKQNENKSAIISLHLNKFKEMRGDASVGILSCPLSDVHRISLFREVGMTRHGHNVPTPTNQSLLLS